MSTSQFEATIATSISVVRREREFRRRFLEQIEGEGSPRQIPLEQLQLVVGRGDDAGIPLASRRASRQHAILTRKGTDFTVRDNNSHNGIFLNGVKIHSAILRDGDVLQIADCAFIFREG